MRRLVTRGALQTMKEWLTPVDKESDDEGEGEEWLELKWSFG